jgi:plasmid stability protein
VTYVKADVPDETHKQLRIAAAEHGVPIEDIAADYLEFAAEHRLAGAEPTTQPNNDETDA